MPGISLLPVRTADDSFAQDASPAVAMPNAHNRGFTMGHRWGSGHNATDQVAVGMPNEFNSGMSEGHVWTDSCSCVPSSFPPGEEPLLTAELAKSGISL